MAKVRNFHDMWVLVPTGALSELEEITLSQTMQALPEHLQDECRTVKTPACVEHVHGIAYLIVYSRGYKRKVSYTCISDDEPLKDEIIQKHIIRYLVNREGINLDISNRMIASRFETSGINPLDRIYVDVDTCGKTVFHFDRSPFEVHVSFDT